MMCLWARKKYEKKYFFLCILTINEERSRTGVGSESGSAPKCHGSPTLLKSTMNKKIIDYFGLGLRFAFFGFLVYEPHMLTNCNRISLRRLHNLFPHEPSRFFAQKNGEYQAQTKKNLLWSFLSQLPKQA